MTTDDSTTDDSTRDDSTTDDSTSDDRTTEDARLDRGVLEKWVTHLVEAWGYGGDEAAYLAATLVDANLRGVDSHGVIRLPAYERRINERLVDPAAAPIVTVEGSVVRVDANGAAGQIATRAAVEAALRVSRETGVATAAVHGSTHFGAAGFYARWLAEQGAVALVVSNSEPIVVPHGGREALLGTNPIAFAAPTRGKPISLDMATSTSAMGRVLVAQAARKPIPPTWGVDADGEPTTDANAVTALLPAGGPKGYGLGFLVEILGGVLTGAAVAHDLGNMYNDFSKPQNVGHWLLVLDIEHFLPLAEFTDRIQGLVDLAHASAPASGFSSVLVPGEPEDRSAEQRERDGIPLPPATVVELSELGERHGLPFPIGDDA
ncbi:Ldh family oxidoreductase [Microbacteriaceae bacterium 4G12]